VAAAAALVTAAVAAAEPLPNPDPVPVPATDYAGMPTPETAIEGTEVQTSTIESGLPVNLVPNINGYPTDSGKIKIAAGWLIEQAGWKGFRQGDAGCHDKQALVLVNNGNATGSEIFELSENIISSVHDKFGIFLHREVNIY
jgi:UDP-N-acetylmuramate dehydrogenase